MTHKFPVIAFIILASFMSACAGKISTDTPTPQTLQDYYKRAFQAFWGAEHLAPDTASVISYLNYELEQWGDAPSRIPLYEDINGYYRVSLDVIRLGYLTVPQLANAFIESAKPVAHEEGEWFARWQTIQEQVLAEHPELRDDTLQTDLEQAARLNAAVRHSEQYRQLYQPHYRILRADVFHMLSLPQEQ